MTERSRSGLTRFQALAAGALLVGGCGSTDSGGSPSAGGTTTGTAGAPAVLPNGGWPSATWAGAPGNVAGEPGGGAENTGGSQLLDNGGEGGDGAAATGAGGEDTSGSPSTGGVSPVGGAPGQAGEAGDAGDVGGTSGGVPGAGGTACTATPERCNGVDDDCDGAVDEDDPSIRTACSTGLSGACATGTTTCDRGLLLCTPDSAASAEVCDGMDNDCDGTVDESPAGAGLACSTGLLGVCAEGVRECIGGTLTCAALLLPATQLELCNGLDNDCDGLVDDDAIGEGAACTTELPGACADGEIHCLDGEVVCAEAVSPGSLPEICNRLDDDCDGEVDEDATDVGPTCDTSLLGVCAAGVTACADGALACESITLPGTLQETCDGEDEDCNGAVDDLPCSTGLPGICDHGGLDCGTGVCLELTEPEAETCNGLDEDCDGTADNGACTERFDAETWSLGAVGLWFLTSNGYDGSGLLGDWLDFNIGCSSSSDAYLALPIDLSHATSASATFVHRGTMGANDSLDVIASVNGGANWTAFHRVVVSSGWSGVQVPLDQFLGVPDFRLGFRFYNGCNDCCGVEWFIDDLEVVIEADE